MHPWCVGGTGRGTRQTSSSITPPSSATLLKLVIRLALILEVMPTLVDVGKFAKLLQALYSGSPQPCGLAPRHGARVSSFERWRDWPGIPRKTFVHGPPEVPPSKPGLPQPMKQSGESDAEGSPKWLSSSDFSYQHRARSHPAIIQKHLTFDFIQSTVKSRQVIDAKRQLTNHREEP